MNSLEDIIKYLENEKSHELLTQTIDEREEGMNHLYEILLFLSKLAIKQQNRISGLQLEVNYLKIFNLTK